MVSVRVRDGPAYRGYTYGPDAVVRAGRAVGTFARYNPGLVRVASRLSGAGAILKSLRHGYLVAKDASTVARNFYSGSKRTQSTIKDYFKSKRPKLAEREFAKGGKARFKANHEPRIGRKSHKQYSNYRNKRY